MNKDYLWKMVEYELKWLSYYAYKDHRKNIDLNKNTIYEQLESIGYTKQIIPLDLRIVGYKSIKYENQELKDLSLTKNQRRNPSKNYYTPLEVWVKLYPNDKDKIYTLLNELHIS